jgi:hypothetical protein
MSNDLMAEAGAVAIFIVAIIALGNAPKRRNYRIALFWLGLTVVSAMIADHDGETDVAGAYIFLAAACLFLIAGAFFAFKGAYASYLEIRKRF